MEKIGYFNTSMDMFEEHPIVWTIYLLAFWYLIIPLWIALGIIWFIAKIIVSSIPDKPRKCNRSKRPPLDQFPEVYERTMNNGTILKIIDKRVKR